MPAVGEDVGRAEERQPDEQVLGCRGGPGGRILDDLAAEDLPADHQDQGGEERHAQPLQGEIENRFEGVHLPASLISS
ncbi:hypothetical protein D3C74_446800 [compost metagenome]